MPNFRYDIQALRAIAVIGVIFFHFQIPLSYGGFSGVDIFFVISGYLMSKIIINGMKNGNFSILGFYLKRIQRIIPALLFTVLVLVSLTFFIYLPLDFQIVTKYGLASLLFFSNIVYSKHDYFDTASENNMFLHTWSLSVEWQFYIILPMVLVLLNKTFANNKTKYLSFFVVITAIIFILTLHFSKTNAAKAFYFLPTRSWEMLIGGIAFLIEGRITVSYKKAMSILGYTAILFCFITFDEHMEWPGVYTLVPVFATFLIIISNQNDLRILKNKHIQLIGKISYSLYLWHWPVFVLSNYLGIGINIFSVTVFLTISFSLALFSYTYIENFKYNQPKSIIMATAFVAIITGILSFKSLNNITFSPQTLEIANFKINNKEETIKQWNRNTCFIDSKGKKLANFQKEHCLHIVEEKINILLIGDSHAAHLSQSFRESLSPKNIHLLQASSSGCAPVLKPHGDSKCNEIINYVYSSFIPKNATKINGVIISSSWINNGDPELTVSEIKHTLEYLGAFGIPAIIIGQNETYTIPYPSIAAREHEYSAHLSSKYLNPKCAQTNSIMKRALSPVFIDIYNLNSFPKLSSDMKPYMLDQNHFTKYGADCVTKEILKTKTFQSFIIQQPHIL